MLANGLALAKPQIADNVRCAMGLLGLPPVAPWPRSLLGASVLGTSVLGVAPLRLASMLVVIAVAVEPRNDPDR